MDIVIHVPAWLSAAQIAKLTQMLEYYAAVFIQEERKLDNLKKESEP